MKKIFTFFLLFNLVELSAQDPSFSQFYNARIYLNPALTGLEPGLSLSTLYRNQWSRVPGQFTTTYASADIQEPYLNSGFGFSAFRNREGEGLLTTQSFDFKYSYTASFLSKRRHKPINLHLGLSAAYVQKSIDWNRLIFSDQLDPVYGVVNPTNAVPIVQNVGYFDAGFGAAIRFDHRLKLRHQPTRQLRSLIGISVHHLTGQDESLQGIVTRVPMRFTVHYGTEIPLKIYRASGSVISIIPNAKFDFQGRIMVFTYGLNTVFQQFNLGFFYQNKQPFVDLRNTNALIASVGWKGKISEDFSIQAGYSYDANVTGLSTRGAGVHEITMRLNFAKVKLFKGWHGTGKRILNCNSFF